MKEADFRVPVNFAEIDTTEFQINVRDKNYQAKGIIVVKKSENPDLLYQQLTYIFIDGALPFPASEMRRVSQYNNQTTRYVYLPATSMDRCINMVMSAKEKTLKAGNVVSQQDTDQYPLFWKSNGFLDTNSHTPTPKSVSTPSIKAKL